MLFSFKRLIGIGLTMYGTALLLGVIAIWAGYRINPTPSVPMGIWKIEPISMPLKRGQIVSVCPSDTNPFRLARQRGYLILNDGPCPGGYIPMFKPIAALPGDTVEVSERGVSVNGKLLKNSQTRNTDSRGLALQHWPFGRYRVQRGMIWLVSSYYSRSFDSRYFGPMPINNVQGITRPIWIERQPV